MGWNSVFLTRFLLYTALVFQFILPVSSAEIPKHSNQECSQDAVSRDLKQEEGHSHAVHCSRERSRAAWNIIEEYLMPFVEHEKYEIRRSCRLHPDNDLFRDQEEHKVHFDTNEWRCGYCKKSFMLEKFLDQHLDNRHYNLLNISQGKCLADLCGALHCDHIIKSSSPRSKCNPAASLRNRHTCESLAHSCFPVNEGPSASRLRGTLFEISIFCGFEVPPMFWGAMINAKLNVLMQKRKFDVFVVWLNFNTNRVVYAPIL